MQLIMTWCEYFGFLSHIHNPFKINYEEKIFKNYAFTPISMITCENFLPISLLSIILEVHTVLDNVKNQHIPNYLCNHSH